MMRLLVAGGGTGGHLYPGIAVADEVRARGGEVLFVGTERGIEVKAVPKAGYALKLITVSGLKRVGATKLVQGLFRLPQSFVQCMSILREFKPDVVVGVGGYASGPLVMTAWMMGLPTAILEQNSIPGVTNKVLGRVVKRVFGSFARSGTYFPPATFVRVGNPVRAALLSAPRGEGQGVLVLGGSQGARVLNENVPAALKLAFDKLGRALPVTHQTGEKDLEATRQRYSDAGITADVRAFLDDMGAVYGAAQVCVCRSGATTCAELMALGKPSVLIPFEAAADDHQTHNARELAEAGAAVLLAQKDAQPQAIADALVSILSDGARQKAMADAALAHGKPHATRDIVDALAQLAGREVRS